MISSESGGYTGCFPAPNTITPSTSASFSPPSYTRTRRGQPCEARSAAARAASLFVSAHRLSPPFDPWPCKLASRSDRGGQLGFQGGHLYLASVGAKCVVSAEVVVVCAALAATLRQLHNGATESSRAVERWNCFSPKSFGLIRGEAPPGEPSVRGLSPLLRPTKLSSSDRR